MSMPACRRDVSLRPLVLPTLLALLFGMLAVVDYSARAAGSGYTALSPVRAADTRSATGVRAGVVPAGKVLAVPIAGRLGVPADAAAATLNVTVTQPATAGHLTVYPCGQAVPHASNLNYAAGQTIPNAVIAKPGTGGSVCLHTTSTTHVVVDVAGYQTGAPPPEVAPPGGVTKLRVTGATDSSLVLGWTNPADADLAQVIVRRAIGSTPPATAASGTGVPLAAATSESVTDGYLDAGTYAYAVFTQDLEGNTANVAATVIGSTAPLTLDSDVDGLPDRDEVNVYRTNPHSRDTDGDSLSDAWEVSGHPNGTPLPGADPRRADIFIEMDQMVRSSATKGLGPSAAVRARIVKTFADSPRTNPDGSTGISLHLDLDDVIPYERDLNPVEAAFDSIRNEHFDPARRPIYHYMVWGDRHSGGSSSGLSFGINAADFIVTLGAWNQGLGGTDDQKVGTFIHELGHNLGLRHGGADNVTYKPNYISVMNYAFQMVGVPGPKGRAFDYQRFDLPDLDEAALDEVSGLRAGPEWAGYATTYWCGSASKATAGLASTDWNCNGAITADPVSSDANQDAALSVLHSFNDWAGVRFDGGGAIGLSGPAARSLAKPAVQAELTWEDFQAISR